MKTYEHFNEELGVYITVDEILDKKWQADDEEMIQLLKQAALTTTGFTGCMIISAVLGKAPAYAQDFPTSITTVREMVGNMECTLIKIDTKIDLSKTRIGKVFDYRPKKLVQRAITGKKHRLGSSLVNPSDLLEITFPTNELKAIAPNPFQLSDPKWNNVQQKILTIRGA